MAVGVRPDGPLPVAVPQRPRSEPLPPAPRRGARPLHGRRRRRRGAARAPRRADARGGGRGALRARRVAAPPARADRGARALARRGGDGLARRDARAAAARARAASARADGHDAFWIVGGRLADWAPLERGGRPARPDDGALAGRRDAVAQLPAEAVAEARIVQTWLASHDADDARPAARPPGRRGVLEPRVLARRRAARVARGRLARRAVPRAREARRGVSRTGSSTTSAVAPPSTSTVSPTAASRRTSASAIGPCAGETTELDSRPTTRSPSCSSAPTSAGSDRRSPRRWRLGLPR